MLKCCVHHYKNTRLVDVMINRNDGEYVNTFTLEGLEELETLWNALMQFKIDLLDHELAKSLEKYPPPTHKRAS